MIDNTFQGLIRIFAILFIRTADYQFIKRLRASQRRTQQKVELKEVT